VNLPLALLCYEDLMPGTQLVNRLQDLRYRVHVITKADELLSMAASAGAMLILADLVSKRSDVCEIIRQLRAAPPTAHLPIIAFADETESDLQVAGKTAGATLVATDAAIILHLPQLIEQALQVE
jgi:PleD family two-component response regulator